MVEQGTHKPLVGSPNLPLGTVTDYEVLFIHMAVSNEGERHVCFKNKIPRIELICVGWKGVRAETADMLLV